MRSVRTLLVFLFFAAGGVFAVPPPIDGPLPPIKDGDILPPLNGGLIGGARGFPGSVSESTQSIASLGTTSYYSGVIQIAAGVTQLSSSAQARKNSRSATQESTAELVRGLQNLSQGSTAVEEGRRAVEHANKIAANEARSFSVGAGLSREAFGLKFEREKAGATGRKVLERMEQVAGVSSEKLIETVNEGGNVYELAAGGKGLKMTDTELAQLVAAANAKAAPTANPELGGGAKMSDLMKDLEMFMAKKPQPEAVAAVPAEVESREPAGSARESLPLVNAAGAVILADDVNPFVDKHAGAGAASDGNERSLFQLVNAQTRKRHGLFQRQQVK